MSTEKAWLEELSQMGFVDVDKWKVLDEEDTQRLLAVLRNDPQADDV